MVGDMRYIDAFGAWLIKGGFEGRLIIWIWGKCWALMLFYLDAWSYKETMWKDNSVWWILDRDKWWLLWMDLEHSTPLRLRGGMMEVSSANCKHYHQPWWLRSDPKGSKRLEKDYRVQTLSGLVRGSRSMLLQFRVLKFAFISLTLDMTWWPFKRVP